MDPQSPPTSGETTGVLVGLLSRKSLAKELNRSERTVIRYERAGMPFIRLGMHRLYEPAKVREWLLRHECKPSTPTRGRPRNRAV